MQAHPLSDHYLESDGRTNLSSQQPLSPDGTDRAVQASQPSFMESDNVDPIEVAPPTYSSVLQTAPPSYSSVSQIRWTAQSEPSLLSSPVSVVSHNVAATPRSYLVWSLFSLLFCFLPLGLAATVYSMKVNSARSPEKAKSYSIVARNLNIAAAVVTPVLVAVILVSWASTLSANVVSSSTDNLRQGYYSEGNPSVHYGRPFQDMATTIRNQPLYYNSYSSVGYVNPLVYYGGPFLYLATTTRNPTPYYYRYYNTYPYYYRYYYTYFVTSRSSTLRRELVNISYYDYRDMKTKYRTDWMYAYQYYMSLQYFTGFY